MYGDIVKQSVIPKDNDAKVDELWNVYTNKKVPNSVEKNSGRKTNKELSDNKNNSHGSLKRRQKKPSKKMM